MLFNRRKVRGCDIRSIGRNSSGMVRSLAKRRIWFTDDDKGSDKDDKGTGSGSSSQGGSEGGQKYDDPAARALALEKRLLERDAELERIKSQNAELQSFRDKKLQDDGNWQEVAQNRLSELDGLKPKAERLDAMLNRISERNKERIAALPEDKRAAVEMLVERLKPEEMADWLDTAGPLFQQPKAPGTDVGRGAGVGGTGQPVVLSDAEREMAKRSRMTEEEYLAAKRALNGD